MIINDEQIAILKPYIKNITELVLSEDVQELLDVIDDVIVDNILGNNDEPDEEGIKLQKLYDEIFNQNSNDDLEMQGLKTQEENKFNKFWKLVQNTARLQNKIFFLDCGEGREFFLDDMEGEDLRGWLIPIENAKEFEIEWEKDDVSDRWIDDIFWAEWSNLDGVIKVEFNTY